MRGRRKQLIAAMLIALLLNTQLTMAAWAESRGQVECFSSGGENKGKGYATPDDADDAEEDKKVPRPDDAPEGGEDPSQGNTSDEKAEKKIIQWKFVDGANLNGGALSLIGVNAENRADFDTVVSMMPKKVRAQIAGTDTAIENGVSENGRGAFGESSEVTLTIAGWSCPEYRQDEEGQWPFTGEYEFTAKLPKGYVSEPPVSVTVTLGGAMLYTINDRFTVDGLIYKELGPDTVQLMGYDGEKPTGTLIIPEKVSKPSNGRDYKVVRIKEYAFLDCSGLTGDLLIPDTVTELGDGAFKGCNFTGELTLSDSLVSIGNYTFELNSFTGVLTLPDKLTYIGYFAFYGNEFTGPLILPKELTHIKGSAFEECNFTGDLIILDSVTHIGRSAFAGCKFTGELTLSKGLTVIEGNTFENCGFTGGLIIPENVTYVGTSAFENCGFTGQLILSDRLNEIQDYAFSGCSGLTGRLNVPKSLTKIGFGVFSGTNLSGFDTTEQDVAYQLYLSGVPVDQILVGGHNYPRPALKGTFTDGNMEYEVIQNNMVKLISYSGNPKDDLIIPSTVTDQSGNTYSVTHIGNGAFQNQGITGTLRLPDTLVCIETVAFFGNNFAGTLSLPDSLTSIGNTAFTFSGFTGDLTIPENVSSLEYSAFRSCGFTGDLTIKGKLTNIEYNAFYECGFTGDLSLPDDVTSIDENAFYGCGFKGSLALPSGVTFIGDRAFMNCTGITGALYIPESVTEIGQSAFDGCSGLTSAHIGSNLQKLSQKAFPKSLPLFTDSPRVQLLLNTYLNHDTIADTSWDGKENMPDGAIATVKQDLAVTGDRRIGTEAAITIPEGITLTVDGSFIADGMIYVNGTLALNGSLSGSGIIYVGRNGKIIGDTFGFRVVYPQDVKNAKKTRDRVSINSDILRGTWERTENGIWKFRQTNGAYAKGRWGLYDNRWYCFDGEGRMLTGWQLYNNQWYYLCTEETAKLAAGRKEGAMLTGWYFDPMYQSWFYLDTSGAMAVGWKEIDGKRYYFNPEADGTRGVLQKEEIL